MIKSVVIAFILLEVDVTLGVVWRTLAQFEGSEMSPRLFQDFMVSVPGVTQVNEEAGSAQDFISLFWCKSGELGSRGSPRFFCVTSVVERFSSDFLPIIISY